MCDLQMMATSGVTTAMLANGSDAKTAVTGGLCVIPVRMAYDVLVHKTAPPPPVAVQTLAIVGLGLYASTK